MIGKAKFHCISMVVVLKKIRKNGKLSFLHLTL